VLPGSHREGWLIAEDIERMRYRISPATCAVGAGGVLVMRPLLLHASAPAEKPAHRRVIHLEFASSNLPDGLAWFERT
jgi:hypothetical protein